VLDIAPRKSSEPTRDRSDDGTAESGGRGPIEKVRLYDAVQAGKFKLLSLKQ
jgi:hypothetical protein